MGIDVGINKLDICVIKKHNMKKLKIITSLLCFFAISFYAKAQLPKDWIKTFPSQIKWYKITDAGVLVVGTKDGLYGISPSEGKEIWKNDDIENIDEDNYDPIEGTPYIVLAKAGLFKSTNKIIDVVTGKQIANTKELGLIALTKRIYLIKSNSVLFYGIAADGKPTLIKVRLADGVKEWEQKKLFEKNSEQIVSEGGEVKDGIFLATNKNIYKLNPLTGESLYSVDMKSDLPVEAPPKKKPGMFAGFKVDKNANERATITSADFFQKDDLNVIHFWNQDILTAFSVADGKEVWTRVKLPSPITNILYDTHGMLVATAEKTNEDVTKANTRGGGLLGKIKSSAAGNKNRASLLCFDMANGKQVWDSDIDLQGDVMAYKLVDKKLILATARDQGSNFISIVNLDEGKSITKKPLSIKGDI